MEKIIKRSYDESLIKTPKEERISTGIDIVGKPTWKNKREIVNKFVDHYGVIMDFGANKYDYSNFETAPYDFFDTVECIYRHVVALRYNNEILADDSKLPHIDHMLARVAIAYTKLLRESRSNEVNSWSGEALENEFEKQRQSCPAMLSECDIAVTYLAPKKLIPHVHVTSEMMLLIHECDFTDLYNYKDDGYVDIHVDTILKSIESVCVMLISKKISGKEDISYRADVSKFLFKQIITLCFYYDALSL